MALIDRVLEDRRIDTLVEEWLVDPAWNWQVSRPQLGTAHSQYLHNLCVAGSHSSVDAGPFAGNRRGSNAVAWSRPRGLRPQRTSGTSPALLTRLVTTSSNFLAPTPSRG
ncbi:MAG: hypothetical protein ACKOFW_16435, partial [Planctomycetaceae bacterium]